MDAPRTNEATDRTGHRRVAIGPGRGFNVVITSPSMADAVDGVESVNRTKCLRRWAAHVRLFRGAGSATVRTAL